MHAPKIHPVEIWAQLALCEDDSKRINDFLRTEFGVPRRCLVRRMHITVYHSRRPMTGILPVSEPARLKVPASDTRFMVLAPGGENPRPELDPSEQRVGIRVHRQSLAREAIHEYRKRMMQFETRAVLGSRRPRSRTSSAFRARNYQPHMSLLRAGSGIDRDLTLIGKQFRAELGDLTFDKFNIDIVSIQRFGTT